MIIEDFVNADGCGEFSKRLFRAIIKKTVFSDGRFMVTFKKI